MRRLKIAFLEDDTADGGLGMVFRELIGYLYRTNEIIYISTRSECELMDKTRYIHLNEGFVKDIYSNGLKRALDGVKHLRSILKNEKPDIVISFGFYANVRICIAARMLKTKVLISERGNAKRFTGINRVAISVIFKRADGIVFQSYAAKNVYPRILQKKGNVIYNAVFKKNIPEGFPKFRDNRIVSVGRIHPDKNLPLLIAAFARISEEFPDTKLIIYGEEEPGCKENYKGALMEQIYKYGIEKRVILAGHCDNVCQEIFKARLFVLSSVLEGMPNALVEAMACGLPVITTNFEPGNAGEIVQNGINGMVVNSNDVLALAGAMKTMLLTPENAERMAVKAKKIKDRLSREVIFNKWTDYINEICR
jgi:GalNAc-alpha-(1->4)-GalNAc-alpha-(1->3)-diNAcBac-PP-undecaprenol alpha-1,4-N-acetyl-D-galactosaminyltransferase